MLKSLIFKIKDIGLINFIKVKKQQFKSKIFSYKFRKTTKTRSRIQTTPRLRRAGEPGMTNDSLKNLKTKNFIPNINFNISKILITADRACNNKFNILGKSIYFKNNINWHQDFKTNQIITSWKNSYYKDIKIQTKKYNSDIKVPWELSRLYHVPALAKAFVETKNTKYLNCYLKNINSWINQNPFLIGVNWVNPMEVSIRAINLIHSFYFLKSDETFNVNEDSITNNFWVKLINNLYQHAIYLENNWEIYYKNNNHYLIDLLGYFYLCFLFEEKNKFKIAKTKTYKKLLKELDKQFMEDGTCYEGSTSYHKLSTEIFLHFYNLCKKNNLNIPDKMLIKLNKAINFIKLNTISKSSYLQIGDNDSSEILKNFKFKLQQNKNKSKEINHYKNFGLTIIKKNNWHISYRHPTYNKKQPTGHFHQDDLSVTFAYKNVPILVDPGTYLYTANKKYRDLLRSYKSHNTFYLEKTSNLTEQDIFTLKKEEQSNSVIIKRNKHKILIKNYYKSKETFNVSKNITFYRKLIFDKNKEKLLITDRINNSFNKSPEDKKTNLIIWNFIFHPDIKIERINNKSFIITDKNNNIFEFKSNLNFYTKKTPYSPKYGKAKKCLRLFAKKNLEKCYKNKVKIIFTKLNPAKT